MKAVLLLSLLVAGAMTAPAPYNKKRFLDSISHLWHQAVDSLTGVWNSAKHQFETLTSGLNVNFDSVVNALIPLIDSDMTESACQNVCVSAASSILGPAASLAGSLCGDVCKAALAKLEATAG